jgi:hypothetical protein
MINLGVLCVPLQFALRCLCHRNEVDQLAYLDGNKDGWILSASASFAWRG